MNRQKPPFHLPMRENARLNGHHMRIFFVCSTKPQPASKQETFLNWGHLYQKNNPEIRLADEPRPEIEYRRVRVELRTDVSNFIWTKPVNDILQAQFNAADKISGDVVQRINCTTLNDDPGLRAAFDAWRTPGNGRFAQSPSQNDDEPYKTFKTAMNQEWRTFVSKKRFMLVHTEYFVEKKLLCVQPQSEDNSHASKEYCCVSKGLHFKADMTQVEREARWKTWQATRRDEYNTAQAALRNF
jgi:hypothetical protein